MQVVLAYEGLCYLLISTYQNLVSGYDCIETVFMDIMYFPILKRKKNSQSLKRNSHLTMNINFFSHIHLQILLTYRKHTQKSTLKQETVLLAVTCNILLYTTRKTMFAGVISGISVAMVTSSIAVTQVSFHPV